MGGLEIALFVLAIAFVIISFFLIDNNQKVDEKAALADARELSAIGSGVLEKVNKEADEIVSDTEERLKELSNDKIMAVGEYSEQVIEKIDTNHREVVFLYQMLQDKEKELKNLSEQLDAQRRECAKLMKDKQQGESRAAVPEDIPVQPESIRKKNDELKRQAETGKRTKRSPEKTESEKKTVRSADDLISRKSQLQNNSFEKSDSENGLSDRNREIIELYHQKKTVLEISKLLNMGQGEVRLIIDLYDK